LLQARRLPRNAIVATLTVGHIDALHFAASTLQATVSAFAEPLAAMTVGGACFRRRHDSLQWMRLGEASSQFSK